MRNSSQFQEDTLPVESTEDLVALCESRTDLYFMGNPEEEIYYRCRIEAYDADLTYVIVLLETWGRRLPGTAITLSHIDLRPSDRPPPFRTAKKREPKMNYANIAALANKENITTVACCYTDEIETMESSKKYVFKANRELASRLRKGVQVVVANSSNKLTKVCMVDEVHEDAELDVHSGIDYCWVVDVVNLEGFYRDVETEKRLVEGLKKAHRKNVADQALAQLGFENININKLLEGTGE